MNVDEVRQVLRNACNGNQSAWAIQRSISPQYVSDVLSGRREPGEAILRQLGLVRVVTYRRQTLAAAIRNLKAGEAGR